MEPEYNELLQFIWRQNRKKAPQEIQKITDIINTAARIRCFKIVIKRFPVLPLVNFCFAKSREFGGVGDGAMWAQIGVALQITADYNYHEVIQD